MIQVFAGVVILIQIGYTGSASTASGTEFIIATHASLNKTFQTWDNKIPSVYFLMYAEYTTRDIQVRMMHQYYLKPNYKFDFNVTTTLNFTNPKEHYLVPTYYSELKQGMMPITYIWSMEPINIIVSMQESYLGMESFKALPVAAWGRRYHAITLGYRYSLLVLTNEEPNLITLTFNTNKPDFTFTYNNVVHRNRNVLKMVIKKYQGYTFSTCNTQGCSGSLTGSTIIGEKPIGIITGNCRSPFDEAKCEVGPIKIENILAEMLLPQETYGKEFVLIQEVTSMNDGQFVIVAGSKSTLIHTYLDKLDGSDGFRMIPIELNAANDWTIIKAFNTYINSSKGILVVYVQKAKETRGGPSMLQIIPMELFYFKYMIMTPSMKSVEHYVVYVVHVNHIFNILTHNHNTNVTIPQLGVPGNSGKVFGFRVKGNKNWKIYHVRLPDSSRFVVVNTHSSFGCYQYGENINSSYMHSAGFVSSPINSLIDVCERTRERMTPLDLTDNDCDGRVDEELANGVDDDKDGSVDEDLNVFSSFGNDKMLAVKALYGSLKNKSTTTTSRTMPTTTRSTTTTVKPTTTTTTTTTSSTTTKKTSSKTAATNVVSNITGTPTASKHSDVTKSSIPTTRSTPTMTSVSTTTSVQTTTYALATVKTASSKTMFPLATVDQARTWPAGSFLVKGLWSSWHCSRDCLDPKLYRVRSCVDDKMRVFASCETQTQMGTCYLGVVCPKECGNNKWGIGCEHSCYNCADGCDKYDGSCKSCKPGFTNPANSCTQECPMYHYGKNCEGDCIHKCNEDCKERVEGTCREGTPFWTALVFILPGALIAVYIGIQIYRRFIKVEKPMEVPLISESDSDLPGSSSVDIKMNRSSVGTLQGNKSKTSIRTQSQSVHSLPLERIKSSFLY